MRFSAILALLCGYMLLVAPAAGAQTDGLGYTEDTVITVQDGVVVVEIEAVMTNTTVENREGNTIYYAFFESLILAVPTGVDDLSINSRGSALSSTADELDDDFDIHTVTLPGELRPGDSRSFSIRYTMPNGDLRGEGLFLSNPAIHAFPIWSFSDPGTGSVVLRVPEEAEVRDYEGVLQHVGTSNGVAEWIPQDFDNPEELFGYVAVAVDGSLRSERFMVAGQRIELRSWPGDDEWTDFARETIQAGLPALEDTIGLPMPQHATLEVTESLRPRLSGYAGWYDQIDTSIELGNELDDAVLIHELSHAWFNNQLFTERWISEGLAEEFTWHVQSELDWGVEADPSRPNLSEHAATPLVNWEGPAPGGIDDDPEVAAQEEYGYNASWYVMRVLTDIIGLEQMRAVIAAADEDATAYGEANHNATTARENDWRRLLDLVSQGATPEQESEMVGLFFDFVVEPEDISLLAERTAAREQYREFLAGQAQWEVPSAIGEAMEAWRFEEAALLMEEAALVQFRFTQVDERAARSNLQLSDAAQDSYENTSPDFPLALAVLEEQEAAIEKVETIREAAERELSTDERWGLGDVSRRPYVEVAEAAFANDDVGQIDVAQARLDDLLAQAAQSGAERLLWLKFAIAAVAGIVVLIGRRQVRKNVAA